ncbi:MAG: hypothetical protein ACODAU_13310, partial [Myxococcota bacterium]
MRAALLALLFVSLGCTSPSRIRVERAVAQRDAMAATRAYERHRAEEGPDTALLVDVAAAHLEQAAWSSHPPVRDAALTELAIAGSAGEPVLDRLARARAAPVARARALALLLDRGERWPRAHLRPLLEDDDPAVVAHAVRCLDPGDEAGRLAELLAHPAAQVRGAAAQRLA